MRPAPQIARARRKGGKAPRRSEAVALVVSDRHEIHDVRDRGYLESPARIRAILGSIERTGCFRRIRARRHGAKHLLAVHDRDFLRYLERACAEAPEGKRIYPYVFPTRNRERPPRDIEYAAGYWCIDTFTPIHRHAWAAARAAVDCGLTAAETILDGGRYAYALVRPPGHHAERRVFGGFCYLCTPAVAAHRLSEHGRVAILDIDYHHGNGQQDIFYRRADVLTISLHGHPRDSYPYFTGFADERGEGAGAGYNVNVPLPEGIDGARYRRALAREIDRIRAFDPQYLVVALGLDTARRDPTGSWLFEAADFAENGRMIAALDVPTLVVQEGGYRLATLGTNARAFFEGLLEASA